MSKVKQYYTDVAEKAVDKIILQVKQNLITKANAITDIMKVDYLNLIGSDEHNIDEVIEMECA